MKPEGDKIRIAFDSVGSGLTAATKTGRAPIAVDPQGKLQGFAIAGEDQNWVWADAVIDGPMVLVSSPAVPKPVAVRPMPAAQWITIRPSALSWARTSSASVENPARSLGTP